MPKHLTFKQVCDVIFHPLMESAVYDLKQPFFTQEQKLKYTYYPFLIGSIRQLGVVLSDFSYNYYPIYSASSTSLTVLEARKSFKILKPHLDNLCGYTLMVLRALKDVGYPYIDQILSESYINLEDYPKW